MTTVESMRVTYQVEPLNVDPSDVRFSWAVRTSDRGRTERSCRLLVHQQPHGSAVPVLIWDSGAVDRQGMPQLAYGGPELQHGCRYRWQVAVTLDDDAEVSSPVAWFETMPSDSRWEPALWITHPRPTGLPADRRRAPYLRRVIEVGHGLVAARWYATAGGVYTAWVNGSAASPATLAPGWTDYRYRVPTHALDVTDLLAPGSNALGVTLADGWYSGFLGPFDKRNFWGDQPVFRAVLDLHYADGTVETLSTDTSWLAGFGPIQGSDLLHGEYFDARLRDPAWATTEPGITRWQQATVAEGPAGHLVPSPIPPVRGVREVAAVAVTTPLPGTQVVDFGQNFAGHVRLRATGSAGTLVQIGHGELLTDDGLVYTDNLRSARATETLVLDGEPITYEPTFTYHGFRYAQVTGLATPVTAADITGIATSSIDDVGGTFHTDHPLLNAYQSLIEWGMLSNFIETPQDCPQRDERLGWGGDAHVFAPTAVVNADLAAFYTKWNNDILDAQKPSGSFADIAPCVVLEFAETGSPGYADAGVFVPWLIYQTYGDQRILRRSYSACLSWLDYIGRQNPDHLWRNGRANDYGDWLGLEDTDKCLVGTAYWARAVHTVIGYAEVLGHSQDADRLRQLHERIAVAFQTEFTDADGHLTDGSQAALVLALDGNLLDEARHRIAAADLQAAIESVGHATTGFLSLARLLPVLSGLGREDLAQRLLLREDRPSWGHHVRAGLTTFAERWTPWTEDGTPSDPWMNSYNHFCLGSFGEWMYRTVGGLTSLAAGYGKVLIDPRPAPGVSTCSLTYPSIRGTFAVNWRRQDDGRFDLSVSIPFDTRARVVVPGELVTESGQPVTTDLNWVNEARPITRPDGSPAWTIDIGSGDYQFTGTTVRDGV